MICKRREEKRRGYSTRQENAAQHGVAIRANLNTAFEQLSRPKTAKVQAEYVCVCIYIYIYIYTCLFILDC